MVGHERQVGQSGQESHSHEEVRGRVASGQGPNHEGGGLGQGCHHEERYAALVGRVGDGQGREKGPRHVGEADYPVKKRGAADPPAQEPRDARERSALPRELPLPLHHFYDGGGAARVLRGQLRLYERLHLRLRSLLAQELFAAGERLLPRVLLLGGATWAGRWASANTADGGAARPSAMCGLLVAVGPFVLVISRCGHFLGTGVPIEALQHQGVNLPEVMLPVLHRECGAARNFGHRRQDFRASSHSFRNCLPERPLHVRR
mmetsp:Transcript_79259/g.169837  ORF Transcript_79259/g.169837 Transcript_79259/m.169837 type:complete len:262 (-) Transcript_79259:1802-2587(-)